MRIFYSSTIPSQEQTRPTQFRAIVVQKEMDSRLEAPPSISPHPCITWTGFVSVSVSSHSSQQSEYTCLARRPICPAMW